MSGTSCDGVDAVAVELSGPPGRLEGGTSLAVAVRAHHHRDYAPALRARLASAGEASAAELARLHVELAGVLAPAARVAMDGAGWAPARVTAIAWAGHTVVHLPPGPGDQGATLAIGDADVVAEATGCPVLGDFRARDRAAGGHGAPLVPFADACLLRRPGAVRGALNLGGIANLTVVPAGGPPTAFDTGPGNMVLDGALSRASGGRVAFDEGGDLGRSGRVDARWLERALASDTFLRQSPPRTTGRERYGAVFLDRHWGDLGRLSLPDLAATLAAYTVESVARGLEEHVARRPVDLVVSGGGALNGCLMDGLARRLAPVEVVTSDVALGIPVLAREAVSFAILGDATLAGAASNVPSVTGARRAVLLGKLSFGAGGRGVGRASSRSVADSAAAE